MVIKPFRWKDSSTISSFSMRCSCSSCLASCSVVPMGAVTSGSRVMSSETRASIRVSKRKSRLVRMPTRTGPLVTGMPEILYFCIRSTASWMRLSGSMVTGLRIMPLMERLTMSTSLHCSAMDMFLWMKPIPPSSARALAMTASVTVSMAADSSGMLSLMVLVRRVEMSVAAGCTADFPGISNTSSKVRPSLRIFSMSASSLNMLWGFRGRPGR